MAKKVQIEKDVPVGKFISYLPENPSYRGVFFRKTKSGVVTWYLSTRVGGKLQWIKIGHDTDGFGPEHVIAKRQEVEAAKFRGEEDKVLPNRDPRGVTLNDAWDRWLQWKKSEGFSDRYLIGEANRYDNHIRNTIGTQTLKQLSTNPNLINNIQGELRDKGYRANTIKQILMNVKKAFKQAQGEGLYTGPIPFRVKSDPNTKGVMIKNSRARRERWLTKEQAQEFMAYLKDLSQRSHLLHAEAGLKAYRQAAFALYTGLRASEVLKLTPNAIDLEKRQIFINRVKHASMADKSRYVDIPDVLVPIIEDLLAEKDWAPNERFFTGFAQRTFNQAFDHFGFNRGVGSKDFVNRISFHSLRHTFGALLVERGVHLVTIKEMMGHDTIEAVQIYAKAGPNVRKQAMETFNQIW